MKMTLKKAIKTAAQNRDADSAGRIADMLRFKYGYNYNNMIDAVKQAGVNPIYWDELLQESEMNRG